MSVTAIALFLRRSGYDAMIAHALPPRDTHRDTHRDMLLSAAAHALPCPLNSDNSLKRQPLRQVAGEAWQGWQ